MLENHRKSHATALRDAPVGRTKFLVIPKV